MQPLHFGVSAVAYQRTRSRTRSRLGLGQLRIRRELNPVYLFEWTCWELHPDLWLAMPALSYVSFKPKTGYAYPAFHC